MNNNTTNNTSKELKISANNKGLPCNFRVVTKNENGTVIWIERFDTEAEAISWLQYA